VPQQSAPPIACSSKYRSNDKVIRVFWSVTEMTSPAEGIGAAITEPFAGEVADRMNRPVESAIIAA
jgi:hypothetical protein